MVKLVGLAIAGIESCRDVFAGIHVTSHVKIKQAVIVVVGPGSYGRATILAQSRLPGDVSESAIAVVVKQLVRLEGAAHKQVFVAVIVIVGKDCGAHSIQPGQPRLRGNIFECSIAAIAKQLGFNPIGNEQVAQSIIVVINRGNSAGPVTDHAEAHRLIEKGRIVLVLEINAGLAGYVDEVRLFRKDAFAFEQRLVNDLERVAVPFPCHPKIGPVNAWPRGPFDGPYVLEADAPNQRTGAIPALQPMQMESELFHLLKRFNVCAPLCNRLFPASRRRITFPGVLQDSILLRFEFALRQSQTGS